MLQGIISKLEHRKTCTQQWYTREGRLLCDRTQSKFFFCNLFIYFLCKLIMSGWLTINRPTNLLTIFSEDSVGNFKEVSWMQV